MPLPTRATFPIFAATVNAAAFLALFAGCSPQKQPAPRAELIEPSNMALVPTAVATPVLERSAPLLAQPIADPTLVSEFNNISSNGAMYFAGWPTEAGLRTLAARGVKRIIALKSAEEVIAARGYDPRLVAKQLGIELIEMPVNAETLTDAYIDAFARSVDEGTGPTLMHCGSASTCGMVWGSYLARKQGLSTEDALAHARAAGLRPGPMTDATLQFVEGAREAKATTPSQPAGSSRPVSGKN